MNRQTEMFPDLKPQGERSFTDTGWGRFPIALDTAGLDPFAFAIYVRLSVITDRGIDIPEIPDLANQCRMTVVQAKAALAALQARKFITIEGDIWTLTDPTEWLPQ